MHNLPLVEHENDDEQVYCKEYIDSHVSADTTHLPDGRVPVNGKLGRQ